MGQYQCVADNGVPPAANQTFQVEVHCKYTLRSKISARYAIVDNTELLFDFKLTRVNW